MLIFNHTIPCKSVKIPLYVIVDVQIALAVDWLNRIMLRNDAELTFEPQFAPTPQFILWAIFGGFPGFPRVPGVTV